MLVVAFDVDVAGPGQLRAALQHGDVRAAGVEPDVEDVGLLAERRAAAFRAGAAGADEVLGRMLVPGVGALFAEDVHHALEELGRGDRLAAAFAVEDRDRHAPQTLARDAPVGTVPDHAGHALLAPRGVPRHFADLFE